MEKPAVIVPDRYILYSCFPPLLLFPSREIYRSGIAAIHPPLNRTLELYQNHRAQINRGKRGDWTLQLWQNNAIAYPQLQRRGRRLGIGRPERPDGRRAAGRPLHRRRARAVRFVALARLAGRRDPVPAERVARLRRHRPLRERLVVRDGDVAVAAGAAVFAERHAHRPLRPQRGFALLVPGADALHVRVVVLLALRVAVLVLRERVPVAAERPARPRRRGARRRHRRTIRRRDVVVAASAAVLAEGHLVWQADKANPRCVKPRILHQPLYAISIPYRHIHARKTAAAVERKVPDALHAARYRHARKTAAAGERRIPDARNAVRYRRAHKADAVHEHAPLDARDAVGYRHARKAAAAGERRRTDALHAVRHRHARKTAAAVERRRPDARNAVRYRHARKTNAAGERSRPDAPNAVRYRHARKPAATGERPFPDARHAARYLHAHKAAAAGERRCADTRNAVRHRHACKTAAIVERRRPDARHSLAAKPGRYRQCGCRFRRNGGNPAALVNRSRTATRRVRPRVAGVEILPCVRPRDSCRQQGNGGEGGFDYVCMFHKSSKSLFVSLPCRRRLRPCKEVHDGVFALLHSVGMVRV